jgi:pimeloyl-ACP methyl ester carboxylesterase
MKIDVGEGARLFFDVEGTKIVASDDGWVERPTVVLLHPGPGADHSLFKDLVGPRLAQVAQVIYVDQRGDGRSDRSDTSHWNLETWTDDLSALLDALEVERPVLLGTSIGALVAMTFAVRHPDRPARLVLASAVARYVHARSIAGFDRLGGAEAGEVAARYFGDPSETTFAEYLRVCLPLYTRSGLDPHVVARMQMNPEATIHWDAHEAAQVDLRDRVAGIRCPVLLLAGEDDPAFTLAGSEELAAALPRERLTFRRYAAAGHGIVRDAPHALDDIAAFVAGRPWR